MFVMFCNHCNGVRKTDGDALIMTIAVEKPVSAQPMEAGAVKKKAARIPWFDGARGYLLTMMYLAHFTFTLKTPALYLHHGMYLPVMDGEFFVLISGYVCALAYYGAHKRGGMGGSFLSVMSRLKWVYLYQILVAALMILVFRGFGQTEVEPGFLADFETPLWRQFLMAAQLLDKPPYLDILLLYMALMLFIPLAFAALEKGWRIRYFAVLIGLWLFNETGLHVKVDHVVRSLTHYHEFIGVRGYFQPLTYAIVFYGAFFLGYLTRTSAKIADEGWLRLRPSLFYACLGFLGLCVALVPFYRLGLVPEALVVPDRKEISVQGLIATAAASYVIWYLIAGRDLGPFWARISGFVRAFFSLPVFQLLGRNSLFVYSLHVIAVFLSAYCVIILGLSDNFFAKIAGMLAGYGFIIGLTLLKNRFLPNLP